MAKAEVIPVQVSSSFNNENWFPLPAQQMKSSAVDTALMKLSELKLFAFTYEGAQYPRMGSLSLVVDLVEPAESAKLTIKLDLPRQNRSSSGLATGSLVSTASVSLRNKDFEGIFNALESLGQDAAEKMLRQLKQKRLVSANHQHSSRENKAIYQELQRLNSNMIMLGDYVRFASANANQSTLSQEDRQDHNQQILKKLDKLDALSEQLKQTRQVVNKTYEQTKVNQDYALRSDAYKINKLNQIYDGILKLSVESAAGLPETENLSAQDVIALEGLQGALEKKYAMQFAAARQQLQQAMGLSGLSQGVGKLLSNEMYYGLPYFEANIKTTELYGNFQDIKNAQELKRRINGIKTLYAQVLSNPQLGYKERLEVKSRMDNLLVSSSQMGLVMQTQQRASQRNLQMMLRIWVHEAIAMGADTLCPSEEEVTQIVSQARVSYQLQRIETIGCKIYFTDSSGQAIIASVNENAVNITH